MKEISIKQILESEAYQNQKQTVFERINGRQVARRIGGILYAPASTLPYFDRTMSVDRETFRQTDRDAVKTAKANLKNKKFGTFYWKGIF